MKYIENLVSEAVKDIRESTIDYVVNCQINCNERLLENLANHDWDLNAAFPRANITDSRKVYVMKNSLHNFVAAHLTKQDEERPFSMRMNSPKYRVRNDEAIAKLIERTRYDANIDFEKFVIKLTTKIKMDDVESVVLDKVNYNLWDYSILHVTRKDDTKEVWKTQMITKTSCLGTVFNQWPTREMKQKGVK